MDAPQLLKHALGLANNHAEGAWQLLYLYFDGIGAMSEEHRDEIGRFEAAMGRSVGFTAPSYQTLFTRLKDNGADPTYIRYLGGRYFRQDHEFTPPSRVFSRT